MSLSGVVNWMKATDVGMDPELLTARQRKAGVYVVMAVASSLFFLLTVAFLVRSQYQDWEHLSAPWHPLAEPWQLWVNTVMLVLASGAIQWARIASRGGRERRTFEGLLLAAFLSACFVAGQLWVWQQFIDAGYYASENPANGFFYVLTGLHGLHLLGGLVALTVVLIKRPGRPIRKTAYAVDRCAVYWHYLLALWLVLMLLLTASPEAFAAFAAMCGF